MRLMKNMLAAACVLSFALLLVPSAIRAQDAQPAKQKQAAQNANAKDAASSKATTDAVVKVQEIDEAGLAGLLKRDTAQPRPLLVNFWATWCDPCREEFPDLVRIGTQYGVRGVDFAFVSLDDVAELGTGVPKFLKKMKATSFPSYLLNFKDQDAAITLVDREWQGELPATFLFDGQGRIVYKHMGRIKPSEVRAALDAALGGK